MPGFFNGLLDETVIEVGCRDQPPTSSHGARTPFFPGREESGRQVGFPDGPSQLGDREAPSVEWKARASPEKSAPDLLRDQAQSPPCNLRQTGLERYGLRRRVP